MKKCALILCLLALSLGSSLKAQSDVKARRLHTTWLRAEVIGILPVESRLAVLQIKDIDSNNSYQLKPQDEILAIFQFAPSTEEGENSFPEIKGGEMIQAEVNGTYNEHTSQYDYRIFRYRLVGRDSLKAGRLKE